MSPNQGVEFHSAPAGGQVGTGVVPCASRPVPPAAVIQDRVGPAYRPVFLEGDEAPVPPPTAETVLASETRELLYSWAGDSDVMGRRQVAPVPRLLGRHEPGRAIGRVHATERVGRACVH